jgi:hypothetical protein
MFDLSLSLARYPYRGLSGTIARTAISAPRPIQLDFTQAPVLAFPRECPRMREDANSAPVEMLIGATSIRPCLFICIPR